MMRLTQLLTAAVLGAGSLSGIVAAPASADTHSEDPPAAVVVLIDDSASMQGGGRFAAAREFVGQLAGSLRPSDRLVLYTFNATATERYRGDAGVGATSLLAQLPERAAGQHTDIGAAIDAGITELARADSPRPAAIVLLTDGVQDAPRSSYAKPNASAWQKLAAKSKALTDVTGYAVSMKKGADVELLAAVLPSTTMLTGADLPKLAGLRDTLLPATPTATEAPSAAPPATVPAPVALAVPGSQLAGMVAGLAAVALGSWLLVRLLAPAMSGVLTITDGEQALAELALHGKRRVRTSLTTADGVQLPVEVRGVGGKPMRVRATLGQERLLIADGEHLSIAGVDLEYATDRVRTLHRIGVAAGSEPADTQRGAAAIEFAIVCPVLILLLFGTVDVGMALNARSVVANAAREGARIAALGGTATQAETATRAAMAVLPGVGNAGTTVAVGCKSAAGSTCSLSDSTPDTGGTITVSVTYVHTWLSPVVLGLAQTLSIVQTSQMRIE